jgi:hypothetical protein
VTFRLFDVTNNRSLASFKGDGAALRKFPADLHRGVHV